VVKKKGTRYFQKSVFVNNKVNEQIQAAQVRVIGSDGMQLGILPIHEAQAKAREYDLDLVEVAPNADPPVCKLMDYGKFRYQQQKRAQEVKKKQTVIQVKELKIRPKIDPHDYQFKLQHVKRFLQRGDKAKISVLFRGREIVHRDVGQKILERFIEDVKEVGEVESMPKMDGHNMTMVLIARSHKKEEKGSNTFQE
jgi:translation initiation factor IF-3